MIFEVHTLLDVQLYLFINFTILQLPMYWVHVTESNKVNFQTKAHSIFHSI